MSALANAATKNISKGSLSATAMLSPQTTQPTRQSPEDDGGFRNRDLAHEVSIKHMNSYLLYNIFTHQVKLVVHIE